VIKRYAPSGPPSSTTASSNATTPSNRCSARVASVGGLATPPCGFIVLCVGDCVFVCAAKREGGSSGVDCVYGVVVSYTHPSRVQVICGFRLFFSLPNTPNQPQNTFFSPSHTTTPSVSEFKDAAAAASCAATASSPTTHVHTQIHTRTHTLHTCTQTRRRRRRRQLCRHCLFTPLPHPPHHEADQHAPRPRPNVEEAHGDVGGEAAGGFMWVGRKVWVGWWVGGWIDGCCWWCLFFWGGGGGG
jgi:hypothetical protein